MLIHTETYQLDVHTFCCYLVPMHGTVYLPFSRKKNEAVSVSEKMGQLVLLVRRVACRL